MPYDSDKYQQNREEIRAKQAEYYRRNKERIKEKARRHYENNRDECQARVKEYRKANREKCLARQKEYAAENADALKAKRKERYESNREEILAKQKQYREKERKAVSDRKAAQRFGVPIEEIQRLRSITHCEICGAELQHYTTNLTAIDHCHEHGHIRGMLCSNCNLLLGHAKDDPSILSKAISYLEERS